MTENHSELDALFADARRDRDGFPDALATRMLADADRELARRAETGRQPVRPVWSQLFDILGGWRGVGGLATACAAGVWIGVAPPGFLPDPAELLVPQDTVEFAAELDLNDLFAEEG